MVNFEFGAQATAIALTAAAQAEAGTKGAAASTGVSDEKSGGKAASYTNGMAVFTVAKGGLMYEASIGGQKFGFDPTVRALARNKKRRQQAPFFVSVNRWLVLPLHREACQVDQ